MVRNTLKKYLSIICVHSYCIYMLKAELFPRSYSSAAAFCKGFTFIASPSGIARPQESHPLVRL
jgi:hypothetical protein